MKKMKHVKLTRGAGVLLPISSLPSPYGIGTLGQAAYQFVDTLAAAGQKYWQVLPLGPTSYGDSPYQSFSAFAGNPYFIDLDRLVAEGLLSESKVASCDWGREDGYVDYSNLFENRFLVLKIAYERSQHKKLDSYKTFCENNSFWLEDYSLYMALKFHFENKEWLEWNEPIRVREPQAVAKYAKMLKDEVDFWKFTQYKFFEQWNALKAYANEQGIRIIGDIPLYVALDSADVWVHGDLFELDERKKPINIAGVPPDAFSADGQRWGNPLYDWAKMEETDFFWWRERMKANAKLYDIIRIDHFIGIVRFFSIPAENPTAVGGTWRLGPGTKLTNVISESIGDAQIIAEDLGVIVPMVKKVLVKTGFPGMKVLQFAFDGGPTNDYLPHNYTTDNIIAYSGTHDNETTVGFLNGVSAAKRRYICDYLDTRRKDLPAKFIQVLYASNASVAIVQAQDLLGLGNEARMNVPSTVGLNWRWRMTKSQLEAIEIDRLKHLVTLYGR